MASIKITKTVKRALIYFAAVIIAAGLIESLFFVIGRKNEPKSFPKDSFKALEFIPVEFEEGIDSNGDIFYTTLANDSYFEITGLNLKDVRSIDIFFEREPGDNTEMVIKFTGIRDGVYGTFTVGIKRIEEGKYRAVSDFRTIENIRIYPTERTNRIIEFKGIELNPVIETVGFSINRVFLWAVLLIGVHRGIVLVLKQKNMAYSIWTSVYLITNAFISLFAYIAVNLFWTAYQVGYVLIPITSLLFTIFFLFVYIIAKKVKKLHIKAFILFLVVGTIFAFASAPLQVPDEENHFARCYAISMGSFTFDGHEVYPNDVEILFSVFNERLKMYQDKHGLPSAYEKMKEYLNLSQDKVKLANTKKVYSNSQLIIPYLPAAFGIFITRLFTKSALTSLYVGRLMNVLMVSLAVLYSLKRSKRHRSSLIMMIFFPITIFMSASTSYDAMFIAAFVIFIGIITAEEISKKDIFFLIMTYCLIVMIKPLYIPLALLIFIIPKSCFKVKGNYLLLVGVVALCGILFWQLALIYARAFSTNIAPSATLIGVDKKAQVLFVLKNPFRFLIVSIVDGFRKSFYLGEFGLFGHLDLIANITTIISPVSIAICSIVSGVKKESKKRNNILLLMMLLIMYITISAGFYVVDSSLGGSTILGIQVRYFIPSVFFTCCLLGSLFSSFINIKSIERTVQLTLWTSWSVALIAAIEVFSSYYI